MSDPDVPLREQMSDGIEKIRKQLERLRSGPTIGGPSDDRSLLADLEAELEALKQARATLGPQDR